MTPQEELFAKLFNREKVLVSTMTVLELRAHREELSKIAFEARAKMTAVDDEEKIRKPKKSEVSGFSRSVNEDGSTRDLINTVKERQKGLSKKEKLIEGLIKLGFSRSDAEAKLSAGAILGKFKANLKEAEKKEENNKPIFNPFEKKKEEENE